MASMEQLRDLEDQMRLKDADIDSLTRVVDCLEARGEDRRAEDAKCIEQLRKALGVADRELLGARTEIRCLAKEVEVLAQCNEACSRQIEQLTADVETHACKAQGAIERGDNALRRVSELHGRIGDINDDSRKIDVDRRKYHDRCTALKASVAGLTSELRESQRRTASSEAANERMATETADLQQAAVGTRLAVETLEAERKELRQRCTGYEEDISSLRRELAEMNALQRKCDEHERDISALQEFIGGLGAGATARDGEMTDRDGEMTDRDGEMGQTMTRLAAAASELAGLRDERMRLAEQNARSSRELAGKEERLAALQRWVAATMSLSSTGGWPADVSRWAEMVRSVEGGMMALSLHGGGGPGFECPVPRREWAMRRPWCASEGGVTASLSYDAALWRLYDLFLARRPFGQEGFALLEQAHRQRTWALPEVDNEFLVAYEAVLSEENRSGLPDVILFTIGMWQYLVDVLQSSCPARSDMYDERRLVLENHIETNAPALLREWFGALRTYDVDTISAFCRSQGVFFESKSTYLVSGPDVPWALVIHLEDKTWRLVQCLRGSFLRIHNFKIEAPRRNAEDDIILPVPDKTLLVWLFTVFLPGSRPVEPIEAD
ncbi:hypothetical protein F4802DRAFT_592672 [Xylaria palmicola]|nr:hypothetical protein F4802DRAFT_592672 [Xylaria palmicola]